MIKTNILKSKRILVTGHTGFTGSWACLWLSKIGVEVSGYALAPNTNPALYTLLNLESKLHSGIGDINDSVSLQKAVNTFQPDAILHLAAQPLVRAAYRDPLWTFSTNTIGTANVMEAARQCDSVKAVLCITTDKVYENLEQGTSFQEHDRLGGKDPYGCSKAAAEMIIQAFMNPEWQERANPLAIAVARGGNIIGGGDWSEDRLVPDFVRALMNKEKLEVRYPDAVRPWQHVLALVEGYLHLLAGLLQEPEKHKGTWNFGPLNQKALKVKDVIKSLGRHWEMPETHYGTEALPESCHLQLNSTKAHNHLNWTPLWDTEESIRQTALWYKTYTQLPQFVSQLTQQQIDQWLTRSDQ